jgi:type IV pilus assembly protein PilE
MTDMKAHGYTLIELLIVLVFISILSAIALPNYRAQTARAHRADARNVILQLAQWMERAATAHGNYPATDQIPSALTTGAESAVSGRYRITIQSPDPGQMSAASYTITAIRQPQGSQAHDACGDFLFDQASRMQLINQAPEVTVLDCWRR